MAFGKPVHDPADADGTIQFHNPLRTLHDISDQDMQIFIECGRCGNQQRNHPSVPVKAFMFYILFQNTVHRMDMFLCRSVLPVSIPDARDHDRIAEIIMMIPQHPAFDGGPDEKFFPFFSVLCLISVHQKRHQKAGFIHLDLLLIAEFPKKIVYFPLYHDQFPGQIRHGNRFQHITNNIILDRLLGITEFIKPAQKGNLRGGADLPHLPRQLNTRYKRHFYIRQKKIRLHFFHQFQSLHTVLGFSYHPKSGAFPINAAHNRPAQFFFIICYYNCIHVLFLFFI